MGLFGESAQSNFRRAQKLVEDVLTALGVSAEKNRLDTRDGSTAWGMMPKQSHLSPIVRAGVNAIEAECAIHIAAFARLE